MPGPLKGVKIVEFNGLGPCPFAAMMLADMGADVIRIERPHKPGTVSPYAIHRTKHNILARGRRVVELDLKSEAGRAEALNLIAGAEAVLEGYRPGVMERLGLGPETCHARVPHLVYVRITGWGQDGPLAQRAGHDINYIALSGMLAAMGAPGTPPLPPLNLIGDFGAGGMMSAFGTLCGILHARATGEGQVVDSAMLDGTNLLGAMIYSFQSMGQWNPKRGRNRIDGSAPYYGCYECADGKFVAVGPIEPEFRAILYSVCELDVEFHGGVDDPDSWPGQKAELARIFRQRTRDEWCDLLLDTDACFSPVLDVTEAPKHPQNTARQNFVDIDGVVQPAPAPRFSRTPVSLG